MELGGRACLGDSAVGNEDDSNIRSRFILTSGEGKLHVLMSTSVSVSYFST